MRYLAPTAAASAMHQAAGAADGLRLVDKAHPPRCRFGLSRLSRLMEFPVCTGTKNMATEKREFPFTQADFEAVRTLLYEHCGIALNDRKQDMVYSRLTRRLRVTGIKTFREYLALVREGSGDEWEAFINALTTNLTSFFREPHHFPILAEHVVSVNRRPVRIWCSASSTGEEPYTIAMTVVDAFGTYQPPVEIIATDIDTNVLDKARAGVYPVDRLEKLPQGAAKRFFLKGRGAQEGFARARQELRSLITFRQLNLLDNQWHIKGPFDAIFCRNVMIYFDKATQRKILERFVPLMAPDALLFAGHSESLHHVSDLFRLQGKTVYGLAATAQLGRNR